MFEKIKLERIEVFDILKGIGIILVIIGHMPFEDSIVRFIYSFHMPLFFIVSGCLYAAKNEIDFIKTLKKLFKRIIIPYVVLAFLSYVIIRQEFELVNFIKQLFYMRTEGPNYALWFLPIYALATAIFTGVLSSKNKYMPYIITIFFNSDYN